MSNIRNDILVITLSLGIFLCLGPVTDDAESQLPNVGKIKAEEALPPTPPDIKTVIQTNREAASKRLNVLEKQFAEGHIIDTEEFEALYSSYSELVGVLDIHLTALTEAEKLAERNKNIDHEYELRLSDLRKNIEPQSFAYQVRLEETLLNSREDLANIQTAIAQRQEEVQAQTKIANDLAKQLRLEREKLVADGKTLTSLESTEIRERLARANADLRKIEVENLTNREKIEKQFVNKLGTLLGDIRSHVQFSKEALKQLIESRDTEILKIAEDIRLRQRELNQELVNTATLEDLTTKRLLRIYSNLVNLYLTLLRAKKGLLEFDKRLITARFELSQKKLTKTSLQQLHDELHKRAVAVDTEFFSQNRAMSQVIEEYVSRQDLFSKLEIYNDVNNKFRSTLRVSFLTLSDISKFSNMMKYLRDSGDFSTLTNRPGVTALSALWSGLKTFWNFEVFVVDESPITVGKLFVALFLFVFGIRASRYLSSRFQEALLSRAHIDSGAAAAFGTISFYALLILSAIISLQFVRIPLTIFTLAGGALAIGIGFGSQTIVKNFFSGLILLFERPLRVGDIIQYDTTIGVVSRIGGRSTLIATGDQLEVVVPNSYLIENTFTNWTLSSNKIRRSIKVGIAYGSPLREAGQTMLAQTEKHNLVLKDPAPDVLFSDFGESAITLTLRFWVQIGTGTEATKVESDLRHMIDGAFREAKIEIAFPQRDMNLTSSKPLQIQLVKDSDPTPVNQAPSTSLPEVKSAEK